ncbi:MAG: hypothetical protein DBY16_08605 [Coprobacter sp.]|nr:MAG: hypothetical protein DBY16_08605 [Coprobacter sp.]
MYVYFLCYQVVALYLISVTKISAKKSTIKSYSTCGYDSSCKINQKAISLQINFNKTILDFAENSPYLCTPVQ